MTHSALRLSNYDLLSKSSLHLEELTQLKPFKLFGQSSVALLHALGNLIVRDRRSREFPDLIAFAYWCSNASLSRMASAYESASYSVGRGIVFHIAPSNVPINFAYSLASGILTGNINIVKVPSPRFEQVTIFCDCLSSLLDKSEFEGWRNRIFLLRYGHDREITDALSLACDIRLIWGGNTAIDAIRQSPLKPKAYDLVFSDRYSFCVINSSEYLFSKNQELIARDFYNDAYLFDQNACTSPHLIIWVGELSKNLAARALFWEYLSQVTKAKYTVSSSQYFDKVTAAYSTAANNPGALIDFSSDGSSIRVLLEQFPSNIEELRGNSGFFLEYFSISIDEIESFVTRNFQTMSYFGFQEEVLTRFFKMNSLLGIDRIVPIGKTLDFSLTWDGYNLASSLTRQFTIS